MKKFTVELDSLISQMGGDAEQVRINLRAREVRARYRAALESVYRETAQLFLEHTNNVYIMKKRKVPTLIVYVDESIFAAELNAQRELIKLKLLELFGELVEEFEIHVSRGKYKAYHPYLDADDPLPQKAAPLKPLDVACKRVVEQTANVVEDKRLRKSFEKAMTADMARKNAENESRN